MAAVMLELMTPPPPQPKLVLRSYTCLPHCSFERVTAEDIERVSAEDVERGLVAVKLTGAMHECIARPDVAAVRCRGCACIRLVCMRGACSFVSVLYRNEYGAKTSCSGMTQHIDRAHPAPGDNVHECQHGCGTLFRQRGTRLSEQAALHERSQFCQTMDTMPYKLPGDTTEFERRNVCENVVRIMRLLKPGAFPRLREQAMLTVLAASPQSCVRLPVEIWTMIIREYIV